LKVVRSNFQTLEISIKKMALRITCRVNIAGLASNIARRPKTVSLKRLLSDAPPTIPVRPVRPGQEPKPSWFARMRGALKTDKEGKATKGQLSKALATAVAIQVVVCGLAVSAEATADKNGIEVAGEIPMTFAFAGTLVSFFAFRRSLASAHVWCKWRWYGVLAVLDPIAIFTTAIGTRQMIFPEPPVLSEAEREELRAIVNSLSLTCFEDPLSGLNLEATLMAWARVFLALASEPTPATDNASAGTAATTAGGEAVAATAGWRLSLESLTAAKATESEVLAAMGVARLVVFLQDPKSAPFLKGAFNLLRSAEIDATAAAATTGVESESVGFQSFSKLLLAVEAAVEGNNNIQCELLFRAFNAKGNGKLTKAELGPWLALLMSEERPSSALDGDAVVDARGFTGVYQKRLGPDELAASFVSKFDKDRDGSLCFEEFKMLCVHTNLRSAVVEAAAMLLDEGQTSPVLQAGRLLQFLMLNPSTGKLPRPGYPRKMEDTQSPVQLQK